MIKKGSVVDVRGVNGDGGVNELFEGMEDKYKKGEWVSLKDGLKFLGSEYLVYIRRLVSEGKLVGVKFKEKGFDKWYVSVVSILEYKERSGKRRVKGGRLFKLVVKISDGESVEEKEREIKEGLDKILGKGG
jgi:hypothetical protein